jgi:hypothetical protein
MPIWPVHVESWQYECCGEPFGVGDRVRWTLVLAGQGEQSWGWPDETLVELRVVGRRSGESEAEGTRQVVSTAEGLEVVLGASATDDDDAVRGLLIEEHHGAVPEDMQPVAGVVRELKVVSQRFLLSGRSLTPIPGAVRFRAVERMPDAFAVPHPDDEAPEQWREVGALVELELDEQAAKA